MQHSRQVLLLLLLHPSILWYEYAILYNYFFEYSSYYIPQAHTSISRPISPSPHLIVPSSRFRFFWKSFVPFHRCNCIVNTWSGYPQPLHSISLIVCGESSSLLLRYLLRAHGRHGNVWCGKCPRECCGRSSSTGKFAQARRCLGVWVSRTKRSSPAPEWRYCRRRGCLLAQAHGACQIGDVQSTLYTLWIYISCRGCEREVWWLGWNDAYLMQTVHHHTGNDVEHPSRVRPNGNR